MLADPLPVDLLGSGSSYTVACTVLIALGISSPVVVVDPLEAAPSVLLITTLFSALSPVEATDPVGPLVFVDVAGEAIFSAGVDFGGSKKSLESEDGSRGTPILLFDEKTTGVEGRLTSDFDGVEVTPDTEAEDPPRLEVPLLDEMLGREERLRAELFVAGLELSPMMGGVILT